MRQWIVPSVATVRESGDELYIVDAPLTVKMENDYLGASSGPAASCPGGNPAVEAHNEQVFRTMILPKVQQAVNTAPEYAELRRVYLARIAAEWYRQRSARRTTAFSGIIDSGSTARWPARTPWKPKDVFDAYVKSYTNGEFNVTHKTVKGTYVETVTYVYGGVDFSRSPRLGMSAATFNTRYGSLPGTVADARSGEVVGTDQVWLGGAAATRPKQKPTRAASTGAALLVGLLVLGGFVLVAAIAVVIIVATTRGGRRGGPPRGGPPRFPGPPPGPPRPPGPPAPPIRPGTVLYPR